MFVLGMVLKHLLDIISKTDFLTSFQRSAWQLNILSFRFKSSKLYLFAIFLTSKGTLCEEVFCQLVNIETIALGSGA